MTQVLFGLRQEKVRHCRRYKSGVATAQIYMYGEQERTVQFFIHSLLRVHTYSLRPSLFARLSSKFFPY